MAENEFCEKSERVPEEIHTKRNPRKVQLRQKSAVRPKYYEQESMQKGTA
jgi:hypothetical protein